MLRGRPGALDKKCASLVKRAQFAAFACRERAFLRLAAILHFLSSSASTHRIIRAGLVRDNNVDQALKALKKKIQREGIFREMKLRGHYEKPSEKRAREKAEAVGARVKLARKKLQREGLLPMKPKPVPGRAGSAG